MELAIDLSRVTIWSSLQLVSSLSSTHKSLIETFVDHHIPEVSVSSNSNLHILEHEISKKVYVCQEMHYLIVSILQVIPIQNSEEDFLKVFYYLSGFYLVLN